MGILGSLTIAGWYVTLAVLWGVFYAAGQFERMLADIDRPVPAITALVLQAAARGRSVWGLGALALLVLLSAVYYAAAPRRLSTVIVFTALTTIPIFYLLAVAVALLAVLIQFSGEVR